MLFMSGDRKRKEISGTRVLLVLTRNPTTSYNTFVLNTGRHVTRLAAETRFILFI